MTATTRKGLRFASVWVIALAFVLSGCKIDGTVEFRADGNAKIDITFEDSRNTMAEIHQNCEGLRLSMEAELTFIKNPKVEDITPPGGHITCKLISNDSLGGKISFVEKKDTYSFIFPDMKNELDYSDFKTKIVVTMPGKVIRSNRGKIDGNKVIIDSFDFFARGTSITAKKETIGSSETPKPSCLTCGKDASAPSSESSGFPVWGWGLAGASVLVVVVGVIVAAAKRRRSRGQVVGPYPYRGG